MLIELEQVNFTYPQATARALSDMTLTVREGECLGLLGSNGSGKSTLARLLNGLLIPDSGTVRVGEKSTAASSPRELAGRVGFVFQDPRAQLFCSTVAEEVAFGPRNLGWSAERIARAVQEALGRVGLEGTGERNPLEMPAASLRWLAIASALALESAVLILDEPGASLGQADFERLSKLLEQLRRERTLVLITHDMELAVEFCDRLVVLENGRLWREGSPAEIFAADPPPGLRLPLVTRVARRLGLAESLCRDEQLLEVLTVGPPSA